MNKCGDCKYLDDNNICVNGESKHCTHLKGDDDIACEHFEEILVYV